MNTIQRIVKNTAVLFAANAISKLLGFFYIMYTARFLGAEGFGVLSFALAFTGIFGVFTDLGLWPLTVREVARDKSLSGKYLGNITVIKIFLVIITFILMGITIYMLDYPEQTIKVVYFIFLSVIFNSFSQMFYSIFQAYEKMEYQSIGQIINSILKVAGALFAISQRFNIVGFASIYFIVSVIILGYSFSVYLWKFFTPKIEVDFDLWKSMIKQALPFGFSSIFVTVYYWIDSVMLSIMKGNEIVGWYNAAYRLVIVLLFIPTAYVMAIFPVMSNLYKLSGKSLGFSYERSIKYMLIISIPIATGITLLSNRVILLIYGVEYIPSTMALQILIWTIIFIFINYVSGNFLESINRQASVAKVTGIGAIINIVLNLLMIPKFSYIGASIATVATEFIVLLILAYTLSKTKYAIKVSSLKDALKVIISSLVIVIIIKYYSNINLILLIFTCAFAYCCMLYITKVFDKKDMLMVKNLLIGGNYSKYEKQDNMWE
jgi:O-antigen/teichoic acid export membrane protein